MRLVVFLFLCVILPLAAEESDSRIREALSVARTNVSAALKLCDEVVASFPTNSQALATRARLLDRSHRYDDAILDLTAALKLDPKSAQLWQGRGEVNFKAGRFKESVADFDRVLEMAPAQAPHHWQRGISLYYAGRFADGRKQFELHRTVNPNDVENAAWHFLCAARERGITNARAAMLPTGADGRVPMKQIYALYRGTASANDVLSAASRVASESARQDALFYAHLYLGLFFDATGQLSMAHEHMAKAVNEFGADHYMGHVARVHLRRMSTPQLRP